MENFYYYVFILGYDLLHEYFTNNKDKECDIVFEKCKNIVNQFLNSEEIKNYKYSEYDALINFLKNKKFL